jgi:HK97 family phage portal protein
MALRERIARLLHPTGGKQTEQRSPMSAWAPPFAGSFLSAPYYGGRSQAENIATICACVDVISSAIATLPAIVYEVLPDGNRRERPDHPVARLIRQPNRVQSWPDLVRFFMSQVLLYGNSLLTMEHDGNGQPIALNPLPWWNAQPIIVPAQPEEAMGPLAPSGRLAFDTLRTIAPWGGTGVPRRYFVEEVFYLRDRSDTGVLGSSRLSRAPMLVQQGLSVQAFATYLWENTGTPNLALTHPGQLSKEAADRIANSWAQTQVGPLNARRVLILEEGMKPDPLSVNPEDMEVLESRKFVAEEIARIFGVPPPLVGIWGNANFASSAQAAIWFATNTLAPHCIAIEREFARVVFNDPDRFHLELDLSALVKGDYATRAQVGVNLVRSGVLTPNELRQELGWDRHPDGDRLVAQATGGRPLLTGDGEGEDLPEPGARPNGSGKASGAAGRA